MFVDKIELYVLMHLVNYVLCFWTNVCNILWIELCLLNLMFLLVRITLRMVDRGVIKYAALIFTYYLLYASITMSVGRSPSKLRSIMCVISSTRNITHTYRGSYSYTLSFLETYLSLGRNFKSR
jgi:hypothetical protein